MPRKNRTGIAYTADGPELVEAVRLPVQCKSETFDSLPSPLLFFILLLLRSFLRRRKPEVRVYAYAISARLYANNNYCLLAELIVVHKCKRTRVSIIKN